MRRMVKRESTFSNWQVYGPITEALRDGQPEHRRELPRGDVLLRLVV